MHKEVRTGKKILPIGLSNFKDIITGNGYYVDKTLFISDWLQPITGNVTLITRPRRFGKTLNIRKPLLCISMAWARWAMWPTAPALFWANA